MRSAWPLCRAYSQQVRGLDATLGYQFVNHPNMFQEDGSDRDGNSTLEGELCSTAPVAGDASFTPSSMFAANA
jgi:hypothetical protein